MDKIASNSNSVFAGCVGFSLSGSQISSDPMSVAALDMLQSIKLEIIQL